ncbi:MAG: AAA family ATPase [Myxococcota bacterium]|jgi:superfamily I DNA/RNA helicase/mRNA-degrading endonuclease RelE of RelBE toxin-antitoxin system|nr:AAA family ATPase [Myxococcota bacterium]
MKSLEQVFRVAIFDQFLDAFARIPRAQQKKVSAFVRKFRNDPASAAINYEKIRSFTDQNLRTVRIGDDYRAIVLRPDEGNIFVLLWVDHHDEAMAWARNKRVQVHPDTGGLQVFTVSASGPTVDAATPTTVNDEATPQVVASEGEPERSTASLASETKAEHASLFAAFSDEELLSVGLPPALLGDVRELCSVSALEALAPRLPNEAFESLFFLSQGDSLEEVREALCVPAAPGDGSLAAALASEASKRSFVLLEDDAVLESMLDAPLEKWRIFLHPSQRRLVERRWNGPVRVLGGAGTGKTVVAMHRAAWLLQHRFCEDDDRLLFTTFTRNLAADIEENLRKLVPLALLKRLQVVHVDKWVSDFLSGQGYRYQIEYWGKDSSRLAELWGEALEEVERRAFPDSFYREEWEYVVQPLGCVEESSYLMARRKGRGVSLSRAQRKEIWPVFARYRALLERHGLRESPDAMRDAASLLRSGRAMVGYRSVLVDEAQDMPTVAFALFRAMLPEAPDDLFIVGDGHQRIYRRQVVLSEAGVKILGRSHRLRINYRTTDEIRRFAVSVLEGLSIDDLDGGHDSVKGYKSLIRGKPPQVLECTDAREELDAIAAFVGQEEANRCCLVTRTRRALERYAEGLSARGLTLYRLRRSTPEDRSAPGLRLATMHRVKGLEFDRIVVAGLEGEHRPTDSDDEAVRAEREREERSLIYVALTRARSSVLVTGTAVGLAVLPNLPRVDP